MTSSENLASNEPWMLRPTFSDSWFSESLSRDNETLTRALTKSLSPNSDNAISPFRGGGNNLEVTSLAPTVSGSEPEIANRNLNRRSGGGGNVTGRISKRKPRVSKRSSQTTFIMADVANFRQMVQQVTGVKFGCNSVQAQVLKPDPQRFGGSASGGWLPTLDTSAFLLDQPQILNSVPSSSASGIATSGIGGGAGNGHVSFGEQPVGDGGFDFVSFPSFPTLESWKVM